MLQSREATLSFINNPSYFIIAAGVEDINNIQFQNAYV